MDVKQAVLTRRSVRRYDSRPVADDVIAQLLEGAVWAPSGTNLQPWHFVAVRSPQGRAQVLELMAPVKTGFVPYLEKRFPQHPQVQKETLSFIETLGNAPVFVLAFLNKPYQEDKAFPAEQSVAAAIQNLLLLAWEQGLATCWLTAPKVVGPQLEAWFAPEKGPFMGLVTLGYGEQPAHAPPRRDGRWELA